MHLDSISIDTIGLIGAALDPVNEICDKFEMLKLAMKLRQGKICHQHRCYTNNEKCRT